MNKKIEQFLLLTLLFLGSEVADFDGNSFLLYRFSPKSTTALKDVISLNFKTIERDGILLHREGQNDDHITLALVNGKLSLFINIGNKCSVSQTAHLFSNLS